jgi:hypothetical protein
MIYFREGNGMDVEWKELYRIKRYPIILKGTSSYNFICSPNFEKMIDFNF